jgi:hypothetical protein
VIILILVGAGLWLQAGTKAEIEQRRLAQDWPTTIGTVTNAKVEQGRGVRVRLPGQLFRRRIEVFKPVINYTYQVAGQFYQSAKYKNGYITHQGEWVTVLPKTAEKIVAQHPPGQPVTVTYNPEQPALAYLVIDLSVIRPWIFRGIGFLAFAVAALLIILQARAIAQDLLAQRLARNAPAVLSATTTQIKSGLVENLGLTCVFDGMFRETYETWFCSSSSTTQPARVYLYSRKSAPDRSDYLSASTDQSNAPSFFDSVLQIVLPQVDVKVLQAWVTISTPSIIQSGGRAETTINGLPFALSIPFENKLKLEIGKFID